MSYRCDLLEQQHSSSRESLEATYLEWDVGPGLSEGMSQQEHVIHSNAQGEERQHLWRNTQH